MATSSSDTAFLTIEKSTPYRGIREHWANSYHFDIIPRDASDWSGLVTGILNWELPLLTAATQIEHAYGHNPGTPPVLVYTYDPPPPGEGGTQGTFLPSAAQHACPGDAAMWLRWGTTQKTSRGKPIYLRNYFHDVHWETTPDTVCSTQLGTLNNMGNALQQGLVVNGLTFRRAGPRGAVAQNHAAGTWITTRTLKHRGKRHRISNAQAKSWFEKWGFSMLPIEIN